MLKRDLGVARDGCNWAKYVIKEQWLGDTERRQSLAFLAPRRNGFQPYFTPSCSGALNLINTTT